jgi:DNA gyrase inhibitor GyrI/AraC-like DNA-binding protein
MSKEYIKRINVVLDFIEKNLEASLSLEVLSQKAHYSPYHFHRVFSTVVGESVNQYVNRKRIERIASILLTNSDQTIKELAYFYGFNSESSFSRAFKKFYGITPTQFKSEGKKLLSKIGIEPFTTEKYICSIDNLIKWMEMNAQLVVSELQEIKLAGITGIGNFDQVGELYNQLMSWGHEKSVLPQHGFKAITIYHDNPNVTPISKVRYSACVTINKDIEAEGEIRPLSIQKGIYIVGRFEIKGEEVSTAWKNMHVWIVENGYEFRDGDYFEIYHNDHKTHPEQKFIIDICIPIEKTKQVQLGPKNKVNFSHSKPKNLPQKEQTNYLELVSFMKELRAFFHKDYDGNFQLGKLYLGNTEFFLFFFNNSII